MREDSSGWLQATHAESVKLLLFGPTDKLGFSTLDRIYLYFANIIHDQNEFLLNLLIWQ